MMGPFDINVKKKAYRYNDSNVVFICQSLPCYSFRNDVMFDIIKDVFRCI